MTHTALEFLLSELKKYGSACPKYEINYVIEIPTHILTELEGQAIEMEKEQREKDFVEGYKKRAKLSGLIFDEASKSSAKELFNKNFKSK